MESDEDEVTWGALQKEIQSEVENNELIILKRAHLAQVQTLIEKKTKRAVVVRDRFNSTCESVVKCETDIKVLYSQLGMVYKDTDSEDEGEGGWNAVTEINGAITNNHDDAMDWDGAEVRHAVHRPGSRLVTTNGPASHSKARPKSSQTLNTDSEEAHIALARKEHAVVVLTKLPAYQLRVALKQKNLKEVSSEEEDLISNDSDAQWEPPAQSSDSDHSEYNPLYSDSECNSSKKRGKQKAGKLNKDVGKTTAPQTHTDATSKAATPQTNTNHSAVSNATAAQTNTNHSAVSNATTAQTNANTSATSKVTERANNVSCVPVVCSVSQAPPNPETQPPLNVTVEEVKVDMVVLGRRRTKTWQLGKILELVSKDKGVKYKVDFGEKGRILLSGHHIAFNHPASLDRLYVGARVVASFQEGEQSWFNSGLLSELPSRKNRMRFLVFFDDHSPSYVGLPLIHLVCRPLENPWEDIDEPTHRIFMEEYLKVWPNPPQAQYRVTQSLNVEHLTLQKKCEVTQVDGSLIQVVFLDDDHKEWIYRGSMRLEHMANMKKRFDDMEQQGPASSVPVTKTIVTVSTTQTVHVTAPSQTSSTSTTKPATSKVTIPNPTKQTLISNHLNKGKVNELQPHSEVTYTPHRCSPGCLDRNRPTGSLNQHRGRNPLLVPHLYGFRRMISPKRSDGKGSAGPDKFYRSPCGLPLGTMAAVQDYLFETRCDFLQLDMFCLDSHVSINTTHDALPSKIYIPDLSQGKETQQVSCINEHNSIRPPIVTYSRERVATAGVSINTSPKFMVGCDCADGCTDSVACSCHQLTVQATALGAGGPVDVSAGYSHKRLTNRLVTGVYECNSQCRCDPRMCSNRLVQSGLQLRLQIFMTLGRGWGVRCLDDVAKGSFICTYSGRVQRYDKKNACSNTFYAKLNHIEGVEVHKPDYETEAYCSDSEAEPNSKVNEEEEGPSDKEDEMKDTSYKFKGGRVTVATNYATRRNAKKLQDDPKKMSSSEGESAADSPVREKRLVESTTTTRSFFDKEEECYIIDSKMEGNVARYLNHSCSPNLFEQNVFVDTHDLRFPWLAFFTSRRIKAGTELTWNYRSFIGSSEGIPRGIQCRCGSKNCQGKL